MMNLKKGFLIVCLLFVFQFGNSKIDLGAPKIFDILLFQSWGFFTNNPLYSNLYHYRLKGDKLEYIPLNTSSLNSFYGLKRERKRKISAFNFLYKDFVQWKITSSLTEDKLLKKIDERDCVDFSKSRSKLNKGTYITLKKEILPFNDIIKKVTPREAIYIFEIE